MYPYSSEERRIKNKDESSTRAVYNFLYELKKQTIIMLSLLIVDTMVKLDNV